jgi:transposase InsO family protein
LWTPPICLLLPYRPYARRPLTLALFYLSTVLDDFSRYIIAWKLCSTMKAEDVTVTLDLALKTSGLDQAKVIRRPRLLSDNGSSYIAADLAKWLDGQNIQHVRGAPYHPVTQGKIERWHQTLKNRILLENYYLPGDLEAQIEAFVRRQAAHAGFDLLLTRSDEFADEKKSGHENDIEDRDRQDPSGRDGWQERLRDLIEGECHTAWDELHSALDEA